MDASAGQVLFPGHVEPTITAAGVQQNGGAVFIACFSGDHLGLAAACYRGDRLGLESLDIEPLRMDPHLVGEIRARDSFRQPRIVVNALSDSGLSTNSAALDAFPGRVKRRGQARRAAAEIMRS